jgi:hypothetical protein
MPERAPMIWAGSKSVLSSGTLMTFGEQGIDVDFWINGDWARVTFAFPRDDGRTRAEYTVSAASEDSIGKTPASVVLRFFNLAQPFIAFTDGPLRLGTVGGNSVWIVYEVTPALGSGSSVKRISYTLWEGPGSDKSGMALNVGEHRG